ncbi:MAG: FHA domain-containing protein, partial [Deltaproteobacteria bacterium]|nr:FHA domain-containing protein [Deltaproteobacteria bacterium]
MAKDGLVVRRPMAILPDRTTLLETDSFDSSPVAEQLRRSQSKHAYLLIIDGSELGRMIPLQPGPRQLIGRDPLCEVVLQDDCISRCHAETILVPPDRVLIRDLNSTNGIFAGGVRVHEAVLAEGDKLLLGRRTILKFVLQDELDETYQRQLYQSS